MDGRSRHVAHPDRAREVDDDPARRVHVAKRREAGPQGRERVARGPERHLGVGKTRHLGAERIALDVAAEREMHVQVDEARNEGGVRGLDDLGLGRDLDLVPGAERGDPVPFGEHRAPFAWQSPGPVDDRADKERCRHRGALPLTADSVAR